MSEYVVVRDTRLFDTIPEVFTDWWNNRNIIKTSGSTPLQRVFDQVNALKVVHGRMHSLFVMCHGFADRGGKLTMGENTGDSGLQLGRENVLISNVSAWGEIQDAFSNIVIYACAAADTEAGNEFTTGEGERLMGALAIRTNATIYIAERIQWRTTGSFNFAKWEGRLLAFPPNGKRPTQVSQVPVSFKNLI